VEVHFCYCDTVPQFHTSRYTLEPGSTSSENLSAILSSGNNLGRKKERKKENEERKKERNK
jgi:hypothetical protein